MNKTYLWLFVVMISSCKSKYNRNDFVGKYLASVEISTASNPPVFAECMAELHFSLDRYEMKNCSLVDTMFLSGKWEIKSGDDYDVINLYSRNDSKFLQVIVGANSGNLFIEKRIFNTNKNHFERILFVKKI